VDIGYRIKFRKLEALICFQIHLAIRLLRNVFCYNPEVLVVAPCGFEVSRSGQEIEALTKLEGWETLKAVQNNAVFLADADLFTQPSTTVVDGINCWQHYFILIFEVPSTLKHKYLSFHFNEKVK
jgi:iron complex transport system substrate-binding protein